MLGTFVLVVTVISRLLVPMTLVAISNVFMRENNYEPRQRLKLYLKIIKPRKKFNLETKKVVFKLSSTIPHKYKNLLVWLKKDIFDVVHYVVEGIDPENEIDMSFSCDSFKRGLYTSFKKASTVTMERCVDHPRKHILE